MKYCTFMELVAKHSVEVTFHGIQRQKPCRPPRSGADPRKIRGQRHVLLDIIIIAVLGTLSSVDDWEGLEEFAKDQEAWLRTFLELPHGIPSHDTSNRVFRRLDPRAFAETFLKWVKGVRAKMPGDVVALDGKTLRGSLAEGKPALHVVSAWSTANHLRLYNH